METKELQNTKHTAKTLNSDTIDWFNVGIRLNNYRIEKNLSAFEIAKIAGVTEGAITNLLSQKSRKSIEILWQLKNSLKISLNWLLTGEGTYTSTDPDNLTQETVCLMKGVGIRKTNQRKEGENGTYSNEVIEFVLAVDKFKKVNQIGFPTLTQIFEIFRALGYRKDINCQEINPNC